MSQHQIKKKPFVTWRFLTVLTGLMILITVGCSFHLREITQIPKEFQTLILESSDPYGPLTQSIRQELRLNRVTIVDDHKRTDIPVLRVLGSSQGKNTVSVFQDGVTVENQLSLKVSAQILVPGHDLYPVEVTVFRAFLDNPLSTLAKESENQILNQEMLKQAAQKLIRQLTRVYEAIFLKKNQMTPDENKRDKAR